MINKIIANYLAGGKRLVIPQFGAFIHKEGDATVVFVPFLKKDDGVLVDLLRKEYGLDEADARGIITEYIAQIGTNVAERGYFSIEGVGNLKIDANGIYFLDYNPRTGMTNGAEKNMSGSSAAASVASAIPVSGAPKEGHAAPSPAGYPSQGTLTKDPSVSGGGSVIPKPQGPEAGRAVREAYYGASSAGASTGSGTRSMTSPNGGGVQVPNRSTGFRGETTNGATRPMGSSSPAGVSGIGRPTAPSAGNAASGATRPSAAPGESPMSGPVRSGQPPVQPARPSYPQRPATGATGPEMGRPTARPATPVSNARPGQPGVSSVPPRPGTAYVRSGAGSFDGSAPMEGSGQPPRGGERRPYGGNRPPVGGRSGRPMPPRATRTPAAKSDKFMIIAILAAIVALASIVYGVLSSSDGPMIDPMEMPVHHNPAQDSLSTGSDSTGGVVTPAAQTSATQTPAKK